MTDNAIDYLIARDAAREGDIEEAVSLLQAVIERDDIWKSIALHEPLFSMLHDDILGL